MSFLEILQTLHEDSGKKWRIRDTIAQRVYDYAKHYEPELVFKKLWGLTMLLCVDDVWKVREHAAKQVWRVLGHCKGEEFFGLMTSDVQTLVSDQKWSCRQLYTLICANMWQDTDLLETVFLTGFLGLCKDQAAGVRISASFALKQVFDCSGIYGI